MCIDEFQRYFRKTIYCINVRAPESGLFLYLRCLFTVFQPEMSLTSMLFKLFSSQNSQLIYSYI